MQTSNLKIQVVGLYISVEHQGRNKAAEAEGPVEPESRGLHRKGDDLPGPKSPSHNANVAAAHNWAETVARSRMGYIQVLCGFWKRIEKYSWISRVGDCHPCPKHWGLTRVKQSLAYGPKNPRILLILIRV